MRAQVVVLCNFSNKFNSCSVLKKKKAFKSIFQKISAYIKAKVTDEDLYLVL